MTFCPDIDDRPAKSYMPCTNCRGKKVDPKKRTRKCPTCKGSGSSNRCDKCNLEVFKNTLSEPEKGKEYCKCYMIPRWQWEQTI
jgi:DnaJ-class molecular chaperone